ncbi:glutamine synthetase family protein [Virgisporangium aurantiacum]|uniref:Glutamine synthetase n=1 Tax=Virgisporangium aurantiacum TaxID=175570 RepID=A0A8J4DWX8_9ACTN|nr:glutamine synthetase family protein [Virgisporangium aurantiacum]GIJ52961.1 glutamine synthetase [Virgisporangium aurantiacum]
MLTLEELATQVDRGDIDTVVVAITDMQGRLQGKRFHARHFMDEVVANGTEGCNYLLAVDVEMNTVEGYEMSSWSRGYGDFAMTPDFSTLRPMPWHPGTALVIADLNWLDHDHTPVPASPRQILQKQLARLADAGYRAYAGTELEFVLYKNSYEDAYARGYRDLTPGNIFNADYSLLQTARVEPFLRRLRNDMFGAGLTPESAKGECNLGQHEVAFKYDEAQAACDNHVIYKNGAKEIAAQEGMSVTFMAKPNAREGNSCHIHFSLRGVRDGKPVAYGDGPGHTSPVMGAAMAGMLATMREFTLLFAPNINSYKRYVAGSFAPTAVRWGTDNRTCSLRLVGHGPASMRVENRVPGADVNPYLAVAGLVAGALHGIENDLALEDEYVGNAYVDETAPHVPATLRDALALWEGSEIARNAFGEDVVAHYANNAKVELTAFDAAVTDWELVRGFERL